MVKQPKQRRPGAGRPSKFTEDVVEKFLQAMRLCNSVESCAFYAGIAPRTVNHWLQDAKENGESSKHHEFLLRVEEAKHSAKIRNVAIIQQAASRDWKAAAWLLERRHHEEFARREFNKHEITQVDRPLKDVPRERLLELARGKLEGDDQGE